MKVFKMKHLYNYLASKNITVSEFENTACEALDNNDWFIPFALQQLMVDYNLSKDCEIELSMVLACMLEKQYTFAKRASDDSN